MSLGSLVISLVAETAQFIQGTNRAVQHAARSANQIQASFGNIAKGILASEAAMWAGQAALTKFTKSFEEAGQAIDSAQSLGTTAQKFYDMKAAIELAGDEFAGIPGLLNKFNAALAETGSEADGKGKLIAALGLSLEELRNADPVDALKMVAAALQDISDPVVRARVGQELLGKSYAESANALAAFAAAGDETTGVTEEMLARLDNLADAVGNFNKQSDISATILTAAMAPALQVTIETIAGLKTTSAGLTSFLSGTLNAVVATVGVGFTILKGAVLEAANAIGTYLAVNAQLASGNFRAAWESLSVGAQQAKEIAKATVEATVAIVNARKNAEIAAAQAKGDFSDIADATARAAAERDFFRRKEIEGANATAKSAAETKKFGGILAGLGGSARSGGAGVDKIAEAFKKVQEEISKAKLSARDFELEKFKALKPSKAQLEKFTLQLDTLDAAKSAQEFKKELADLEAQMAALGMSAGEQALAAYAKRLEDTGIKGKEATTLLAQFQAVMAAKSAADFAKDLAALNLEIEKVGKSAQAQAELDITAQYKDDPAKRDQMLAANARKFEALNREGVGDIFKKLQDEQAAVGSTPLTAYIQELERAQELNPLITDQVIALASAQKKAALEAADAWAENQRQAQEAAGAIGNALTDMVRPGAKAGDIVRNLAREFVMMAYQAMVVKPLLKQLEGVFSGLGGGGGGGGILGTVIKSAFSFFGGGKSGGGDVQGNGIYEVAETAPELLRVNNRYYLMPGSHGTVETARSAVPQASRGSSSRTVHQTLVQNFNGLRDAHDIRRSQQQQAGRASMELRSASRNA